VSPRPRDGPTFFIVSCCTDARHIRAGNVRTPLDLHGRVRGLIIPPTAQIISVRSDELMEVRSIRCFSEILTGWAPHTVPFHEHAKLVAHVVNSEPFRNTVNDGMITSL